MSIITDWTPEKADAFTRENLFQHGVTEAEYIPREMNPVPETHRDGALNGRHVL